MSAPLALRSQKSYSRSPSRVRYVSEQKANLLRYRDMARRPDMRKLEIMSREELNQIRETLAGSGVEALRFAYNTAYARCRMVNGHAPSARSIQKLVQVWRQLWRRQSS